MPKLVSPNGVAVLTATSGANFYRIQGIEVLPAAGVYGQDLMRVGLGNEPSIDSLPHDFDFDRDYVHGDPTAGSKRGLAMNGVSVTVENCYFSAFTSTWQDTQAINGWNGPGPYTIKNNYLEAGTETVAFGGAVPSIPGLVPSDILIQNNYFFKPLSWRQGDPSYAGIRVFVKNHFELKNAQRVTLDSNVFENNWVGADQRGFAFMFSVRTEVNQVPWAVVNDITLTNNTIRHSAAGIDFLGHDDNPMGSGSSSRFLIRNNLWQDISGNWGGDGRLFQFLNGVQDVTIDHNTAFQTGFIATWDMGPSYNLNFTNNIFNQGAGIVCGAGNGTGALNDSDIGGSFLRNIVIGGSQNGYPSNNFYVTSANQVGFVDFAGGNYALSAGSPYRGAGTDGKDVGASAASTSTPPSIVPSGWTQIISKNSGKCLDVSGISLQPMAYLQQWDCWGGDNQKFMFTAVPGGYMVTAKHSGLQLDVTGGPSATYDGAVYQQYPFWGGSNQIFQVNKTDDGYFTVTANNSGKCMDVEGISLYNGAVVQQWSCWGGDNQKWSFLP